MIDKERTTNRQEARQSHFGRAHFDRNSLSAMHSRSVFPTLLPGMTTIQERAVAQTQLLAYNIVVNGIQKPVKHGCMLSEVFQSFAFPSCKSGVLPR